jgi:ADP-ribosylglycohydrolase
MRVAPIGFIGLDDPRKARDLAFLDAALTHWDPVCGEASAFLALLVSAHLREEPEPDQWAKAAMESRLSPALMAALEPETLSNLEDRRLDGEDMGHVLLTLQTAVSVLASGLGYEQGLLWTLRQGGDTDTNGAVVGALLGVRDGIETIPAEWINLLAERDRIDEMARRFSSAEIFS